MAAPGKPSMGRWFQQRAEARAVVPPRNDTRKGTVEDIALNTAAEEFHTKLDADLAGAANNDTPEADPTVKQQMKGVVDRFLQGGPVEDLSSLYHVAELPPLDAISDFSQKLIASYRKLKGAPEDPTKITQDEMLFLNAYATARSSGQSPKQALRFAVKYDATRNRTRKNRNAGASPANAAAGAAPANAPPVNAHANAAAGAAAAPPPEEKPANAPANAPAAATAPPEEKPAGEAAPVNAATAGAAEAPAPAAATAASPPPEEKPAGAAPATTASPEATKAPEETRPPEAAPKPAAEQFKPTPGPLGGPPPVLLGKATYSPPSNFIRFGNDFFVLDAPETHAYLGGPYIHTKDGFDSAFSADITIQQAVRRYWSVPNVMAKPVSERVPNQFRVPCAETDKQALLRGFINYRTYLLGVIGAYGPALSDERTERELQLSHVLAYLEELKKTPPTNPCVTEEELLPPLPAEKAGPAGSDDYYSILPKMFYLLWKNQKDGTKLDIARIFKAYPGTQGAVADLIKSLPPALKFKMQSERGLYELATAVVELFFLLPTLFPDLYMSLIPTPDQYIRWVGSRFSIDPRSGASLTASGPPGAPGALSAPVPTEATPGAPLSREDVEKRLQALLAPLDDATRAPVIQGLLAAHDQYVAGNQAGAVGAVETAMKPLLDLVTKSKDTLVSIQGLMTAHNTVQAQRIAALRENPVARLPYRQPGQEAPRQELTRILTEFAAKLPDGPQKESVETFARQEQELDDAIALLEGAPHSVAAGAIGGGGALLAGSEEELEQYRQNLDWILRELATIGEQAERDSLEFYRTGDNIEAIQQRLDEINGLLATADEAEKARLQAEKEDLERQLAELQQGLANLRESIAARPPAAIQDEIQRMRDERARLNGAYADLFMNLADLEGSHRELIEAFRVARGEQAQAQSDLAAETGRADAAQAEAGRLQAALGAAQEEVARLRATIGGGGGASDSALQAQLAAAEAARDQLQGQLDAATAQIAQLTGSVDALRQNLAGQQATADAEVARQLADAQRTLEARLAQAIAAKDAELAAQAAQAEEALAAMRAQIAALEAQIGRGGANVEEQLRQLREAMDAQIRAANVARDAAEQAKTAAEAARAQAEQQKIAAESERNDEARQKTAAIEAKQKSDEEVARFRAALPEFQKMTKDLDRIRAERNGLRQQLATLQAQLAGHAGVEDEEKARLASEVEALRGQLGQKDAEVIAAQRALQEADRKSQTDLAAEKKKSQESIAAAQKAAQEAIEQAIREAQEILRGQAGDMGRQLADARAGEQRATGQAQASERGRQEAILAAQQSEQGKIALYNAVSTLIQQLMQRLGAASTKLAGLPGQSGELVARLQMPLRTDYNPAIPEGRVEQQHNMQVFIGAIQELERYLGALNNKYGEWKACFEGLPRGAAGGANTPVAVGRMGPRVKGVIPLRIYSADHRFDRTYDVSVLEDSAPGGATAEALMRAVVQEMPQIPPSSVLQPMFRDGVKQPVLASFLQGLLAAGFQYQTGADVGKGTPEGAAVATATVPVTRVNARPAIRTDMAAAPRAWAAKLGAPPNTDSSYFAGGPTVGATPVVPEGFSVGLPSKLPPSPTETVDDVPEGCNGIDFLNTGRPGFLTIPGTRVRNFYLSNGSNAFYGGFVNDYQSDGKSLAASLMDSKRMGQELGVPQRPRTSRMMAGVRYKTVKVALRVLQDQYSKQICITPAPVQAGGGMPAEIGPNDLGEVVEKQNAWNALNDAYNGLPEDVKEHVNAPPEPPLNEVLSPFQTYIDNEADKKTIEEAREQLSLVPPKEIDTFMEEAKPSGALNNVIGLYMAAMSQLNPAWVPMMVQADIMRMF